MPDPQYPSIPQAFTFRGRDLKGRLLSYAGKGTRRYATHEFLKRKGARIEDMERGPRRLDVRLVWTGDNCAREYQDFIADVDDNPYGLLVHPTAGRWQAFCEGPQDEVDLSRAVDMIEARVSWIETELDAAVARETQDVATATQEVSAQQSAQQMAVATFMGALAKAETTEARALAALDTALDTLDTVTAPVDFMRDSVVAVSTAQSTVVGKVLGIQTAANLLTQDVQNLVDSTTDLFAGGEVAAATADNIATLIGTVQQHAEDLNDTLMAAAVTPAGAADAVGATDELLASCLSLSDALEAARPPTKSYTVPALTDVISLAQLLRADSTSARNVLAFASDILNLNRIANPAAIPAGTVLLVPLE